MSIHLCRWKWSPLKTRLDEHTRPSSPVGEHCASLQHDIDWDGVKVLDKEGNWFRRGVKEAINIKRTNSATLIETEYATTYPSSYNRLISSRVSSPSGLGHVISLISQKYHQLASKADGCQPQATAPAKRKSWDIGLNLYSLSYAMFLSKLYCQIYKNP